MNAFDMSKAEFRKIYDHLNRYSHVKSLAEESGIDEETLFVIYTQRTVRRATRNYYRIKNKVPGLVRRWERGESFVRIAASLRFPPILTALLLFQGNNISKKRFWEYVENTEDIKDNRLRREIKEVKEKDMIYSPHGYKLQYERGQWGEQRLQEWLGEQKIPYRTEEEIKGLFPKTPDALLDQPILANGSKIYWIESKASFGDDIEVRKNYKKQLEPYTQLFGKGMVVYWYGYLSDLPEYEDVIIVDNEFFQKPLTSDDN